ncbi:MAG TPA: DUF1501 domain-containing protein [Prosthecobacter sp.]|nr:DUF1501 domain-containing protein [Prosthecobacter sp.]
MKRREFLGQANCAAVSSLPILNTLLNLKLAGSVAAAEPPPNEYRALVCIFLNGGLDSFNMLAPRGAEHAAYANVRQDLALAEASLLPINPLNTPGRSFGLHPQMPELRTLFENGHAAFVANVGTLIEQVTLAQYNAGAMPLPLGLFSHSDQIEQWQTSIPHSRSGIGWGGRMADLLHDLNTTQSVSMNVSLAGSNVFQTGNSVFEYAITQDGATALNGYKKDYEFTFGVDQIRSAGVDGMLAQEYGNLLMNTFKRSERSALDAYDLFSTATNVTLPPAATFPGSALAQQLRMVAKTVAGREALGMKRQTFFLNFGGWDHHDEVLVNTATMLPVVSQAVGAFYNALELLGMQNQVALFLASDFGRTLTSNGRGSDHAWGGNMFVVGGAVNGRRIFGHYPTNLEHAQHPVIGDLDTGRGRLIPTTSVDSYFAELALWLGVPKSSLPIVLPNIEHFYSLTGSDAPIGFLPV